LLLLDEKSLDPSQAPFFPFFFFLWRPTSRALSSSIAMLEQRFFFFFDEIVDILIL